MNLHSVLYSPSSNLPSILTAKNKADGDNHFFGICIVITFALITCLTAQAHAQAYNFSSFASGFAEVESIAADGSSNVYISDVSNVKIYTVSQSGSGPVSDLQSGYSYFQPVYVAVGMNGSIYAANFHYISYLSSSNWVAVLGGNPESGPASGWYASPSGIAADSSGNVYASVPTSNAVIKITPSDYLTFAYTLPSSAHGPFGVTISTDGNVYTCAGVGLNGTTYTIYQIQLSTGTVTQGPQVPSLPIGVASDSSGTVYILTTGGIFMMTWPGGLTAITISGLPARTSLSDATGIAIDGAGAIYLSFRTQIFKGTPVIPGTPVISVQPVSQYVTAGGTATFSITASASAYQWQMLPPGGPSTWTNLSDNGNYSGSVTSTLTVSNTTILMSGDQFRCVATNAQGSQPSQSANLTVYPLGIPAMPLWALAALIGFIFFAAQRSFHQAPRSFGK